MKHFMHHFISILHGLIRTHKWPAPNVSGFIAQLVRALHRYREVQTPLKSWLFQASIRNCLNCVHKCDDHSLLDFKSAVQYMKHFIYHFTSSLHGLIRSHKWRSPNVSGFIAQLICMYVCIYYWPSARSRWLDIGRVLFLRFYGPRRSRGP